MEADAKAGNLDFLVREADEAIRRLPHEDMRDVYHR